jgi:hypothetical protein
MMLLALVGSEKKLAGFANAFAINYVGLGCGINQC